ncbi:MAG: glycosyl hydrolase 115 family protein [Bacteroidales bacterium]|nr:glycosyl hydrolase 115 family protein [Bacteroidales bacterium]
MKIINKPTILLLIVIVAITGCRMKSDFLISGNDKCTNIYIDENTDPLIIWAINDLADDIHTITGNRPEIFKSTTFKNGEGIYVGEFKDPLIKSYDQKEIRNLKGSWEKFHVNVYQKNLVIAGSDIRGTVYGIFEVAERLGISPWKWWADVKPIPKESLSLKLEKDGITESPSVQYRGIFLNDEIWGLKPWAAKTFETETGEIGPKTYEKIFQLLLRLKANSIWPAMHYGTKAFYKIPGNNEIAGKYKIVVGTSHIEPMMRNNIGEWDTNQHGEYNYFLNSDVIRQYWQERIKQVKDAEKIITIGIRGVGDAQMKGGAGKEDQKKMLEKVMKDQRAILQTIMGVPPDSIPQALVLYKEVLELYDLGLKVPDDVTLMWCDDNHGYIRRLSNEKEQKRNGGSGIYYHLSYWGSPHDYLWLSTTQPGRIWEEMSKAYANGAQKIWIANVGDIKPAEYNIEFFLDMAWDINSINNANIDQYMNSWAAREFGEDLADDVTKIMDQYYRLASIRRPEFMGWDKVEPQGSTNASQFNSNTNSNELLRRIKMYEDLSKELDRIISSVPQERLDAFYQLVEYPVKAASLMNAKFLYAQMAQEEVDTLIAEEYADLSRNSFKQIEQLSAYYNDKLSSGKWKYMMSMRPRNLKVFDMPENIIAKRNPKEKANPYSGQREFIQGYEYKNSTGSGRYTWGSIKQLGYSNAAITIFPLNTAYFEKEKQPYVEYEFNAEKLGPFELQVRCLPGHSNNQDHQLGVQLDNESVKYFFINTVVKSEEWSENILRNSQIVNLKLEIQKPGKHSIRLYVNQTGIVIDQLSIDFAMDEPFYEIPNTNKESSNHELHE